MDTQSTTEAIKEITERYELYKDIVKIGLGALIGASASLITVLLKNKHELKRIDKQHYNETNKHKLEIKAKILEDVIELVNNFSNESYNFFNQVYKVKHNDIYFKDMNKEMKTKILANRDNYVNSLHGVSNARRKLEMIGATEVSNKLSELKDSIHCNRNKILNSDIKVSFTEESWDKFRGEMTNYTSNFNNELNTFFLELK